jgi:hypothetical protein
MTIPVSAQLSLDSKDLYEDIQVDDDTYTCVQDVGDQNKFYYMPSSVRLAEVAVKGGTRAQFNMLKYQYPDPANPESLLEGAIVQFAVTMSPTNKQMPKIKELLAKKVSAQRNKKIKAAEIRVVGVPIKKSRVSIYQESGELMQTAGATDGVGPTSTTAKIPFFLKLTKLGSKVFEEVFKSGGGGWPIYVEYQYIGLTPNAGFKVQLDWSKIYDHYSKNDRSVKKSSSWFGLSSSTTETDKQELTESLKECGALKIEVTASEELTMEMITTFLDPIIARINEKLLSVEPPKAVEPARASRPSARGFWGSRKSTSTAEKTVKKSKLGKETVDMNVRFYQTRTNVAAGLVNLSKFGSKAELEKKYIKTLPYGDFETARFSLPAVSESALAGITQVDIICAIDAGNLATPPQQAASWTAKKGNWVSADGKLRNSLVFPLQALYDEAKSKFGDSFKKKLNYKITYRITFDNGKSVIETEQIVPMFDGDLPYVSPMGVVSYVEIYEIDEENFYDGKDKTKYGIERLKVQIKNGSNVKNFSINKKEAAVGHTYIVDRNKDVTIKTEVQSKKFNGEKERAAGKKSIDKQKYELTQEYKAGSVPRDIFVDDDMDLWEVYWLDNYSEYPESAKTLGSDDVETPDDAFEADDDDDEENDDTVAADDEYASDDDWW